jgi:DNA polymerase-3 subunit alpha
MGSPEERVIRAKELGMKALAITDHNHLGGVLDFQAACKKHGIKPLLGVELYWTWDKDKISLPKDERDKIAMELALENGIEIPKKAKKSDITSLIAPYQYDTRGYHIILFAKNQKGWENIVKIQSEASQYGLFNGRYHCDNELLRKYSEGVILTTACIGSVMGRHFRKNEDEVSYSVFKEWVDIVGKENVFVEIQGLEWEEQGRVNEKLIEMADNFDVKVVCTNDVHILFKVVCYCEKRRRLLCGDADASDLIIIK